MEQELLDCYLKHLLSSFSLRPCGKSHESHGLVKFHKTRSLSFKWNILNMLAT